MDRPRSGDGSGASGAELRPQDDRYGRTGEEAADEAQGAPALATPELQLLDEAPAAAPTGPLLGSVAAADYRAAVTELRSACDALELVATLHHDTRLEHADHRLPVAAEAELPLVEEILERLETAFPARLQFTLPFVAGGRLPSGAARTGR